MPAGAKSNSVNSSQAVLERLKSSGVADRAAPRGAIEHVLALMASH